MKHFANAITSLRIVFSALLLLTKPLGAGFFTFYTLCGLSDIFDGAAARITKSQSAFGAKLDSAADFIFVLCAFLKLLPSLYSKAFIIALIIIMLIKLAAIFVGAVKYRKFMPLHTALNKITGAVLFCAVYILPFFKTDILIYAAAALAFAAALEELILMIFLKEEEEYKKYV